MTDDTEAVPPRDGLFFMGVEVCNAPITDAEFPLISGNFTIAIQ